MKTKDQILLEEAYEVVVEGRTNFFQKISNYIKNGCNGDLDLSNSAVETLPKELTKVGGNLILIACVELYTLPDNFTVGCDLDLRYSNIEYLPNNLTVGGSIYLQGCGQIKTLPKNLKIGGDLGITSTSIQLKDIKHYIDIKCNVYSYNFEKEDFQKHNENLKKYGKLKEKLPELEGIF